MPPRNPPQRAGKISEDDRRSAIQRKLASLADRFGGHLPTGFDPLDAALRGGLPRGHIIEIFGPSASGKTTLALRAVASLQRAGHAAAWIDADRTFDAFYAAGLGVALDALPVVQPVTTESAIAMARGLAESKVMDLIVVDSAAALVPSLEIETGIGSQSPGLSGRVLASGLRTLARVALRSGTSILLLNPGTEDPRAPGGAPLKLLSAVRIGLSVDHEQTRFLVVKNRISGAPAAGEIVWPASPKA